MAAGRNISANQQNQDQNQATPQAESKPQDQTHDQGTHQVPAQTQNQPSGETQVNNSKSTAGVNGTSKDRLFFTLPNFLTLENAENIPPLTTKQKFAVTARSSFDYVEYPWYAVLAGISQAQNSEAGYGQGWQGYGKRYGAAFADGTIENFFTSAILPSVLKQDPRYYQLGHGSFWHRTEYAVSRIFITRTDSGNNQFNYSEIVGSGASSAISTYSYHPSQDRTFSNTMSVWGSQVGIDTFTYVVKEFWPDIRRKIKKEKSPIS
jgi:hypothetical protein